MGKLRVLLPWLAVFHLLEAASASSMAKPGCAGACGDIEVPYPFGLSSECSYGTEFHLNCNESADAPKLMWRGLQVLNLDVERGEMTLPLPIITYDCQWGGQQMTGQKALNITTLIGNSAFTLSNKNKFTTIGCHAVGFFSGSSWLGNFPFTSGCATHCRDLSILEANSSSCDGDGCCQTAIPKGMRLAEIHITRFEGNYSNFSPSANDSNCGYAFLVKEDYFTFQSNLDLKAKPLFRRMPSMPVLVDWVIGSELETCQTSAETGAPGCRAQNSTCVTPVTGYGYRCNCSEGFQGNPYLEHGCQDICESFGLIMDRGEDGRFSCKSAPASIAYRAVAACLSSLFLLLGVGRLVVKFNLLPKWVINVIKQNRNQKEPDPSSSTGEDMRRNAKKKKRYPAVEGEYLQEAKKCKKKLRTLISENRCAPIMLCLAWQDVNEKTGKPFGTINHQFAEEDINMAVILLAKLKGEHSFNKLSDSDIRQLAGVVAVEVADGPDVAFHPGREDNAENMPEPRDIGTKDYSIVTYLREVLIGSSLSLSVHDIVLISPWLRCNRDCSGFQFTWPPTFDNSYFKHLISEKKSSLDHYQQALLNDAEFLFFVQKYAADEASFFADYAKSHMKLSELGFPDAD